MRRLNRVASVFEYILFLIFFLFSLVLLCLLVLNFSLQYLDHQYAWIVPLILLGIGLYMIYDDYKQRQAAKQIIKRKAEKYKRRKKKYENMDLNYDTRNAKATY